MEERLASCLDLCVFFSSCLEQAGLHALIIFEKGHAYAGCWLQDEDFSSAVVDDLQAVRKRVELKELLVFEPTLVANAPPARFSDSIRRARTRLAADEDFYLAVDISRCRNARIRPLAQQEEVRVQGDDGSAAAESREISVDVPEDLPTSVSPESEPSAESIPLDSPEARLENWKRKLLDLSLRNRLLNFRAIKRTVAISCPDAPQLEDLLADGKVFKFRPSPEVTRRTDPRSIELHFEQRSEDLRAAEALQALARGELFVEREQVQLESSLIELYRSAKSALDEGGTNILYLAIGFLIWNQRADTDRKLRAPLILFPVQLTRRSVRSGFRLSSTDEEARFNPTLLELLGQDFRIEMPSLRGELPTDAHGLDVEGILQTVRREVRDIPGWEVVSDVVLSTFSFAKHLMWQDLVARTEVLKANPVVKHLIDTPREPYQFAGALPDPRSLDDVREPHQTFCPLLADSSQLSAIIAAAEGRDFVLYGPPGTGKSQTIANMIAQCLAENKTVLFVSEKTAALEVVYRRLQKVGIGEFCLELHSNKTRKADVLQQLGAAWEATGEFDAEEWRREAERLRRLRNRLNEYVRSLHRPHSNRWTAYQAIGEVVSNGDIPKVLLSWPEPDCHTPDDYDRLIRAARNIDSSIAQIGSATDNPLQGVEQTEWTPSWQSALIGAARNAGVAAARLRARVDEFVRAIGLPPKPYSLSELSALATLPALFAEAYGKSFGFLFDDSGSQMLAGLKKALEHIQAYVSDKERTSVPFTKEAIELPLDAMSSAWDQSAEKWWLTRWLSQSSVRKALRKASVARAKSQDPLEDMRLLTAMRGQVNAVDHLAQLQTILGPFWKEIDTDQELLEQYIRWSEKALSTLRHVCTSTEEFTEARRALRNLLGDGNSLLGPGGPIDKKGAQFSTALSEYIDKRQELEKLAIPEGASEIDKDRRGYLDSMEEQYKKWVGAENRLRYWVAWRSVRRRAIELNLAPLVTAVESVGVRSFSAEKLFVTNYARWWINALIDREDPLRKFVPIEHERCIREFRDLDEQFTSLTEEFVRAKLAGNIPDIDDVSRDPEWSILSRELQKKRRHMPIRQLISRMPNTLTRLTPCVMMSPLSVAQFLAPDTRPFDVVIFDEASQIPVWDAIGAIARGKQCVVVGDPKQLPPTTFFDRRDDEDSDQDVEVEDLESILDECIGASLPTLQLNWHYRSLSESLITFSNSRYYGGRLVTFPPPEVSDTAVQFHSVDGTYERGGARINKAEGQAIVDELIGRLEANGTQESFGIVTFNAEQQNFIQDLLDNERRSGVTPS